MDRSILHCDMNNFYASVERLFDPTLQGVPVAVCGDVELRHGIVLAKSEEAKKCGVKTGDAIWQAKEKCPELRIVPPRFDRYVTYSRYAREIYLEYTDLVESFGLDECWLDVTASRLAFGDGVHIATEIRNRIRMELGLTISAGISFNKIFAKLGSDLKKPDAHPHSPRYLSGADLVSSRGKHFGSGAESRLRPPPLRFSHLGEAGGGGRYLSPSPIRKNGGGAEGLRPRRGSEPRSALRL